MNDSVIYCYSCGASQPSAAKTCSRCLGLLYLSANAERFGRAYLLNNLGDLVARGLITEDVAERIRGALAPLVTGVPVHPALGVTTPPAPIRPAAPRQAETRVAPLEPTRPLVDVAGLFTPERAPSLLLYLGAFLIVVAALIFVSVSGRQISDALKLVLLLIGTIGFLAGGLLCHRIPRVLEAGRTFLIIGALLTPLDFAAYYVLISHAPPLSSPPMWVAGSFASAALYGALSLREYGRVYAFLCYAAAISGLVGLGYLFVLALPWDYVVLAAFALAVELIDANAPAIAWRITRPLELTNRVFAAVAFALVAFTTLRFDGDRLGLVVMLTIATVYYARRSTRGETWERWLAVVGPGTIALAFVYAAHGSAQTYGFVLALLAAAYGIVGDAARRGTPLPVPVWIRERALPLSYVAAIGAFLPVTAYWRAPLVGAVVELGLAVLLIATAVLVATRETKRDVSVFVLGGAVALHFGALYLLLTLGVVQGGISPFTRLEPRDFALAFAPVALALGAATFVARERYANLVPSLGLAALLSSTATVALTAGGTALGTGVASAVTAGVVAGAVVSRQPRGLWIGAAFAGVAAACASAWLNPPPDFRPFVVASVALALFAPSFDARVRENAFARTIREIAIVTAGVGVLLGYAAIALRGDRIDPIDTNAWLTTVPALLVAGSIATAEALYRRSERGVMASTAFFLAAALMIIARLRPTEPEAYTVVMAAYLAAVAWGIERYGSAGLRAGLPFAQVGAAIMLMGPTFLAGAPAGTTRYDIPRAVAVLGEALVVLRVATLRGANPLAITALSFLGLEIWRGVQSPLQLEATTAIFGAITLAFALLAPRFIVWRADARMLEATELAGALLVIAPPLARAAANRADALEHGLTVLIAGVAIVLLGLVAARRALVISALGALSFTGVLALSDTARSEPYVAAAGVALLVIALSIPRYLRRRLPVEYEWALEVIGSALLLSGALERTFRVGDAHAWRALAEGLLLVTVGIARGRRALSAAGLGGLGVVAVWILSDPRANEFPGIVGGAYLIALSILSLRYARTVLDPRALLVMELGGAALFVLPTLLAGWMAEFFPRTVMVFVEIFLVLGVGIVFRRRWLVAGALAAIGVETVRALVDVVNRLPNWALFGASGVLLLAGGFILLLRREAWNAWSRQALNWWVRL